ncbi:hypothetical protein ABL78_2849 [Leptomonas seymouri]|uniref:Uncharacterized protein n=1 Tax=Leptomonas seymouri TaxID=5684 RepID=A0A0N1I730_LEPSE|nr:hypothetical protein ABL78_2849 [Leptomonas seymouri]|eukprot:KPI88073.1 hypothetical protein ABL78_2849 [Leptomonas seymouri]
MEEIVVYKQNSVKSGKWTQRVLSLHADLGLAAITSKDAQEDKLHKCMRLANVQIWPQYEEKHIKDDYQSSEAKLTVRVKGLPAKIGFRDVSKPAGPQRIYRYTRPSPGAEHLAWMIRFKSLEDLEKAVRLFRSMKPCDMTPSAAPAIAAELPSGVDDDGAEVQAPAVKRMIEGDVEKELHMIREPMQQASSKRSG